MKKKSIIIHKVLQDVDLLDNDMKTTWKSTKQKNVVYVVYMWFCCHFIMNFQQTIIEIKGKSKLGLVGLLTLCIKQVKSSWNSSSKRI